MLAIKSCVALLQTKMVSDRRASVSRAGASDSPFREARGMSQQSSSELDKSLMQVHLLSFKSLYESMYMLCKTAPSGKPVACHSRALQSSTRASCR